MPYRIPKEVLDFITRTMAELESQGYDVTDTDRIFMHVAYRCATAWQHVSSQRSIPQAEEPPAPALQRAPDVQYV